MTSGTVTFVDELVPLPGRGPRLVVRQLVDAGPDTPDDGYDTRACADDLLTLAARVESGRAGAAPHQESTG